MGNSRLFCKRKTTLSHSQHEIDVLDRCFRGCCPAAPAEEYPVEYKEPIAIVRSASVAEPETGKYSYSYETENGIAFNEAGEQKQIGEKADEIGTVSKGSYSYESEGVTYTVNWVADENGFQASGAHLPVAPPMPAHVVQLLADLRAAGQLE